MVVFPQEVYCLCKARDGQLVNIVNKVLYKTPYPEYDPLVFKPILSTVLYSKFH